MGLVEVDESGNSEWVPIVNYEGHYCIRYENFAPVIRSIPRTVTSVRNGNKLVSRVNCKLIKQCCDDKSDSKYSWVHLSKGGVAKTFSIPKLVKSHFLLSKYSEKSSIIDHIDGDETNNQNKPSYIRGSLVGCYYAKKQDNWISQIQIGCKKTHIGVFKTELEAHRAYVDALLKLESVL